MKRKKSIANGFVHLKAILIVLLCLVGALPISAQEVKVNTAVDKKEILIGDHISYINELTFDPQKFRIQLPRVQDTFQHFELVERKKLDSSAQQNVLALKQESILTNYDSGVWTIPAYTFTVTPLDGSSSYEIQSKPIDIQVNTIAVDTSKAIMPIYEIIEADQSWWDAWKVYILGALGLLLLAILIYFLYKKLKNRNKQPKEAQQKYIAPWDAAHNALQKLIAKELWTQEEEKQHHTRLTDIVRTYIEDTLDLDCFEKTSQEIITDVKKSLQKKKYKGRQQELERLRNIFLTADLVKFAKSKPTELEHEKSNQDAKDFVQSTAVFFKKEIARQSKTTAN